MTPPLAAHPIVLIILDGWGMAPRAKNNAIAQARTPMFERLWTNAPHCLLEASGLAVGLPPGQTGNSEAGHLNIGAGRLVEQDAIMISHKINEGSFFRNPEFQFAIDHVLQHHSNMHLVGLLTGDQSAHAYPEHVHALLQLLYGHGIKNVFLHLFTDGRDSSPHSALRYVADLRKHFLGEEKIASVMGRFYAMDRVKEWGRVKLAYEAIVEGKGWHATNADDAIIQAYNRGENDEYIHPTVIMKNGKPLQRVVDNDGVIFFNIRSDRVRQLAKAFSQGEEFVGFERPHHPKNLALVTLTDFGPDLPQVHSAYPFRRLEHTLPFVFADYRQLYISESEKYAHITYFFNGGYSGPVAGEERVIIQSPRLYTYDKQPEMNAEKLTDVVLTSIERQQHDVIVMNYPNADMVGHTGNIKAAVQGIEYIDYCIGRIEAAVRRRKGLLVITADHGNADYMINPETGEIDTAHSLAPVPLIISGPLASNVTLRPGGALQHIAPTLLDILGIARPSQMTAESLCQKK